MLLKKKNLKFIQPIMLSNIFQLISSDLHLLNEFNLLLCTILFKYNYFNESLLFIIIVIENN